MWRKGGKKRKYTKRARGNTFGWGTALLGGRSLVRFPMVSLGFFIDIIFAAAWKQSLTQISTRYTCISGGVKAVAAYCWQPHHFHVPILSKSGSLELLEPSQPVTGISSFFHIHKCKSINKIMPGNSATKLAYCLKDSNHRRNYWDIKFISW